MDTENGYEMVYGSCVGAAALNLRVFTIFITYLTLKIPH